MLDEFSNMRVKNLFRLVEECIESSDSIESITVRPITSEKENFNITVDVRGVTHKVRVTKLQADYFVNLIKQSRELMLTEALKELPKLAELPTTMLKSLALGRLPVNTPCGLALADFTICYTLSDLSGKRSGPTIRTAVEDGDVLAFVDDLAFGGYCGYYSERESHKTLPTQIPLVHNYRFLVLPLLIVGQLLDNDILGSVITEDWTDFAPVVSLDAFRNKKKE